MANHNIPAALARVLPRHSTVGAAGELQIGGCSVPALAAEFGTPLFAFDETELRETMRRYRTGMAQRWPRSRVCFASKSLPCVAAYAIAQSEGLSVDVAGEGELFLALAAGVAPGRIVLHGNAKSLSEIEYATSAGVGLIVIDNPHDIDLLDQVSPPSQDVLIRVLPEIDADTHPSVATGGTSSKFGIPLAEVPDMVDRLRQHPGLNLKGVHVHIGSQIQEIRDFVAAVRVIAGIGTFEVYNIGGGLGVNYSDADDAPEIEEYLDAITEVATQVIPKDAELIVEPGRSLVARSGITVYSIRNVKRSHRDFVAVDGGMSDQMNIALTDDRFTAVIADRVTAEPDTTAQLVGRQCESGDLLVDAAELHAPSPGDTVVIASTGAYGYTFVNNYNGALHPPIVFCRAGEPFLATRRQSYDELLAPHTPALARDWSDEDIR